MMSPSPQRHKAAFAVQGNNKPLTPKSNWATTFDDCEGNKAPMVELIALIAILHHCKSTIALATILVSLQPPSQQMGQSKTFILSSWEATLPWLCHTTNNVVHCTSNNNNKCVDTSGKFMIVLTAITITLGRCPSTMREMPGW
jgi:hypothetical protein